MIKKIQAIQHFDYTIFSKVKECAEQIGVFYFRLFENSCHVQRTDYLLICNKLVFTISSSSEIEISVINVKYDATKVLDYYIPISKIQNSVIYNIIEKFIRCESYVEYSELKEYLEDFMNIETIKIGNQEWTTENLKLYDNGLGKDHWCSKMTGETFYSLKAAVRIVSEQAKGFHIPSAEEWDELAKACGCVLIPTEVTSFVREGLIEYGEIDKLKELLKIKFFNGFYEPYYKSFNCVCDCSYFWMTSVRNERQAYIKAIDENTLSGKYGDITCGLSIRLVKDV